MREKRVGIKRLFFSKGMMVAALSMVLALTGCGSSSPLPESVAEVSFEDVSDSSIEESSKTETSEVTEEAVKEVSGADASSSASSEEVAAEATSQKSSEYGIEIDKEVDKSQIIYFEEPVTMYSQRALNVRTGPSTQYDILGYLEYNTEVKVLGQYGENGWYVLEFFDGEGFASNRFLAESQVDLEAQKAAEEAAALAAIEAETAARQAAEQQAQGSDQPTAQTQTAPAAPTPVAAPAGILFIGDSRCVQMQAAVSGGGCSWVCESAKGYVWLNETAIGQANNIVGKGTKVVICLGVNDTQNIDKYAELCNAYAAVWAQRGAKTYFCSVNPVWENPYRTEEQVIAFNNAMPGKLVGITWLDTHAWMEANGYRLVDGLHYDANTYINLFNYIVGSI